MAEMKNICGKIPMELHTRVRQEIEQREISTQQFIQQVIEEHFTEKGGQISMAVRTVAVQVSEELFARFKAAVAKKGCRQKDFLIALIEKAIEEIEAEDEAGKECETPEQETETETEPAEPEEESVTEREEAEETEESKRIEEPEEPIETEPEEPEKAAEMEEADEEESGDSAETESEGAETETEKAQEAEIA
nr:hypothetical protein [uncultured Schaedlerella sp.]